MIDPRFTFDIGKQGLAQRFLNSSAVGNWMGSSGATVAAPDIFYAGPSSGQIWRVTSIANYMQQGGTETAAFDRFWRSGAALTNGILFRKSRNGILDHYLIADPITTAFEMIMSYPEVFSREFATSPWGDGALEIIFLWKPELAGFDLWLDGDKGERVDYIIQDTMPNLGTSGHTMFYDLVKG